ncbi:isopeptide-forming domain-containing fimbrial protein [uncultured Catenibacterium sp.]|uniref:isopeptide-forming domain-containing fimbrial protein n=1 Tax=uncultured Catenibacterium sp. TaxID=286142 RepID=UPI0025EB1000|nr:isopeptide-forming domain-containing fimbrial protein [uncultured Catenibacterium sp.]
MKLFKKFASFVLAFAMVMAIAMPSVVKAAGSGSITITGAKAGHTFEAYQIFAGDASDNTLSNLKWGNGVSAEGQTALGNAKEKADSLKNAANAKEFASEVAQYLTTAAGTSVPDGQDYQMNNLAPGYYLVKDKDGSVVGQDSYTKFILKVVGTNVSAAVKSDVPTSQKKVKDTNDTTGETTGWQDSADYDIGDKVPFQLTGNVASDYNQYKSAYQLVFHDTLSAGLTFDESSVKVYVNDSKTPVATNQYTITYPATDGHSFDVTIHDVRALGENVSKVRVEYEAELNKNAVIGAVGNPNEMHMEFSNNPNSTTGTEKGQTPTDKVIVFTYKVIVNKINSDRQPLSGAAFKLEKILKDGSKKVVKEYTIGEDENDPDKTRFEFTGLDDGQYILTETVTPDGYNTMDPITFNITAEHDETSDDPKLISLNSILSKGTLSESEKTFTVNKNKGTLTAAVVNYMGSELPSTGGMGTTVLYVAGTIMILAAGVFLVMKKKAENN